MTTELKIPSPGESITEVQIANWLVADGSHVNKGDDVCELETDKASLTLQAESSGAIFLLAKVGATLRVGDVIARIESGLQGETGVIPNTVPLAQPSAKQEQQPVHISPLAKKLMEEKNINPEAVTSSGYTGRIGRKQVDMMIAKKEPTATPRNTRNEQRVSMSPLRKKLSERLVSVRNTTAMLTTFNEVNMQNILDLRKKWGEQFKEQFGFSLGLMSFFSRAVILAIQEFPVINARIDEGDIVYHPYVDLGIAVSTPKGLMVPVVRDAHSLTLREVEHQFALLAQKAKENKISIEELTGGTFTITNGGVFGSMMSTPLLNPPQSAILGMHKIMDRPVAVNGKVEIQPMMYIALSYDHRLIDGKESVGFIVKVKELLEQAEEKILGSNAEKALFA